MCLGCKITKRIKTLRKLLQKNLYSDCLHNAIDKNQRQSDKIKYSGIKGVRSHFKLQDLFFWNKHKDIDTIFKTLACPARKLDFEVTKFRLGLSDGLQSICKTHKYQSLKFYINSNYV